MSYKIQNKKIKLGFTLSETLIVVVVLGIIASLTISNLIQSYNERVTVSRVKKTYSMLNNVVAQAQIYNGPVYSWDVGTRSTQGGAEKVYDYISPYLHITKHCGTEKEGTCFSADSKTLHGKYTPWSFPTTVWSKSQLKDGTHVAVWSAGNEACSQGDSSGCFAFLIDINGTRKPNRVGKDIFNINVFGNGELRINPNKEQERMECMLIDSSNKNGTDCLYWILNRGNMDYLRRDVTEELKLMAK